MKQEEGQPERHLRAELRPSPMGISKSERGQRSQLFGPAATTRDAGTEAKVKKASDGRTDTGVFGRSTAGVGNRSKREDKANSKVSGPIRRRTVSDGHSESTSQSTRRKGQRSVRLFSEETSDGSQDGDRARLALDGRDFDFPELEFEEPFKPWSSQRDYTRCLEWLRNVPSFAESERRKCTAESGSPDSPSRYR
ncbi:hypothetical protein CVT26_004051 [Gymnopilus dilepis]|uniref:Uncharacterized protein n=1 Tax=Gymnopilus dilepis TaxID=231916 RepID=A0A409WKU3_9AGAR|nr:hypothetical protein CVT26_004051 [Gymnopilus dilepis]